MHVVTPNTPGRNIYKFDLCNNVGSGTLLCHPHPCSFLVGVVICCCSGDFPSGLCCTSFSFMLYVGVCAGGHIFIETIMVLKHILCVCKNNIVGKNTPGQMIYFYR